MEVVDFHNYVSKILFDLFGGDYHVFMVTICSSFVFLHILVP